jgi:hypothetical protein
MCDTPIDKIYAEHQELKRILHSAKEYSLEISVDASFRKELLLSAGSYFESAVREGLLDYCSLATNNNSALTTFLKNKAIERQYFTYFQWEVNNANSFFGLFGPQVKEHMVQVATKDSAFAGSIKAFLEIGRLRNNVVHQNYVVFSLDKTVDELYELYREASGFPRVFFGLLRSFGNKQAPANNDEPGDVS